MSEVRRHTYISNIIIYYLSIIKNFRSAYGLPEIKGAAPSRGGEIEKACQKINPWQIKSVLYVVRFSEIDIWSRRQPCRLKQLEITASLYAGGALLQKEEKGPCSGSDAQSEKLSISEGLGRGQQLFDCT